MSYNVLSIPPFDRQLKRLAKKFPSLKIEYAKLAKDLENNPIKGKPLGNQCYKIRLAISSKGKGKSGGARIIIYVQHVDHMVFFLTIYDKSKQEDLSDKELKIFVIFY